MYATLTEVLRRNSWKQVLHQAELLVALEVLNYTSRPRYPFTR